MVPLHSRLPPLQLLPPRLLPLRPHPRLRYRYRRQMAQTSVSACISGMVQETYLKGLP